MKKLILFIFLFISTFSYSQTKDVNLPLNSNGEVEYSEVIIVDSISKNELLSNFLSWVNIQFKSGKSAIELIDKETGVVIVKGNILDYPSMYTFTLKMQVKDGKYKYTINNIKHCWGVSNQYYVVGDNWGGDIGLEKPQCGNMMMFQSAWIKFKITIDSKMKYLIVNLKTSINQKDTF